MIHEILPTGPENAIPGERLAALLNMEHRELTKRIELERQAGAPICAMTTGSDKGYYMASSASDVAVYCASLDRRLRNMQKTRAAMGDTLVRMLDQSEIDWGD